MCASVSTRVSHRLFGRSKAQPVSFDAVHIDLSPPATRSDWYVGMAFYLHRHVKARRQLRQERQQWQEYENQQLAAQEQRKKDRHSFDLGLSCSDEIAQALADGIEIE